jgi:hypothetical protein
MLALCHIILPRSGSTDDNDDEDDDDDELTALSAV